MGLVRFAKQEEEKARWAVTHWKTKRSRRKQKSHGHYPRPAGGRDDIRRETNEERTVKEDENKLDNAKGRNRMIH